MSSPVHPRTSTTENPRPHSRVGFVLRAGCVLLAAIAMVAAVASAGKWATVERLVARIRTAEDNTAGRLVRELAAFGGTAYPALVAAAGSERSAVALAARQEIDRLLDEWRQQARLEPASFALDGHALPLARAVSDELAGLTPSGRRWARRVLISLLDLAQQQSFDDRLALIRVCDTALSSLPADDPPLPFDADVDYRLTLAPPSLPPQASDEAFVAQPRSVQLGPPQPVEPSPPEAPPAVAQAEPLLGSVQSAAPLAEWDPAWDAQQVPTARAARVPAYSASTTRQPDPQPVRTQPEVNDEPTTTGGETDLALFKLLATGNAEIQKTAAKALEVRGYGLATPRDARMMLSSSAADRVALVTLAMTSSRLEASTWLWRLAHDPSGEVRAAAYSGISTSGNRQLISTAIERVLRDTDPRVAEQAAALRNKLK